MLYLSQAIGRPVRDRHGEPIGKVADLIVAVGDRYPPVTGLVVETDRRRIFLPWTSVERSTRPARACARRTIDIGKFHQRPNEILLQGRPAGQADRRHRRAARSSGSTTSASTRSRARCTSSPWTSGQPGCCAGWASRAPSGRSRATSTLPVPERYIDWEDVDPVETSIASVKLRVPAQRASPSCIRRTWPRSSTSWPRATGPACWPPSTTRPWPTRSRRWSPRPRSRSSRTSSPARAADILEEMSPDDAADLVADLDQDTRDEILALMERDEAEEVQELLGYPEDRAGGIMTTEFIALAEHLTAAEAIDRLRELEPDAETIYYVYVDRRGRTGSSACCRCAT